MRQIKIMDGVRLITSKKVYILRRPTDLWKAFGWDIKNDVQAGKNATEVIRALIMNGRIDLTEYTDHKETCIVEVIPADNYKVQWKEQGKRRWKDLDDIHRFEDDAKAEVERLTATCDTGKEFRVGRWD